MSRAERATEPRVFRPALAVIVSWAAVLQFSTTWAARAETSSSPAQEETEPYHYLIIIPSQNKKLDHYSL